jgi:hypothetical protein
MIGLLIFFTLIVLLIIVIYTSYQVNSTLVVMNTRLSVINGSVEKPGIYFGDDTSTGFSANNGKISISTPSG